MQKTCQLILITILITLFTQKAAVAIKIPTEKNLQLRSNNKARHATFVTEKKSLLSTDTSINTLETTRGGGHADHKVWAPSKRWTLLVGYWVVSFFLANQFGLVKQLLQQDVKAPNHWMYFVGFVGHIPLMLAAWDYSAYAFNRPVSLFSALVYPIGHNCDTLRWFFSFDLGRRLIKWAAKVLLKIDNLSMVWQFVGGWAIFAAYMMVHRATFELSYLPEHHPPQEINGEYIRGNGLYIITGIAISIPVMWIFHFFDDMIWGMALQYAYNLYVALRVRIPSPFDDGNQVDEFEVEPWKKYLMPGTY